MSYVQELIADIQEDNCPACGAVGLEQTIERSSTDPEEKEGKWCPCCGRQFFVMGPEELVSGLVAGWNDETFPCKEGHVFPRPKPSANPEPETPVETKLADPHFISKSCEGERCLCGSVATHKIAEAIPQDEPMMTVQVGQQTMVAQRHEFTQYLCCQHFKALFGDAVFCP